MTQRIGTSGTEIRDCASGGTFGPLADHGHSPMRPTAALLSAIRQDTESAGVLKLDYTRTTRIADIRTVIWREPGAQPAAAVERQVDGLFIRTRTAHPWARLDVEIRLVVRRRWAESAHRRCSPSPLPGTQVLQSGARAIIAERKKLTLHPETRRRRPGSNP